MKFNPANFFTGASGHIRIAACGLILACLLIRFPDATAWLGADIQKGILKMASEVKEWAWTILLLGYKQYNATGGTKPASDLAEKQLTGKTTPPPASG